ncbi:DEKNAAC100465 [Brettanomyces naardenensis]|uniref:DEKNAAC100465 n=1 Tax=Brettanomyces naardenensis TaxID=13370 RepID=A0A448YFG0_BRENA|nr:DEKNAAC100465 [Brettanomyces naardenensis]
MLVKQNVILEFYRTLQRDICNVPLDSLAKKRLSLYVHREFRNPISRNDKNDLLYKRLENGKQLQELLEGVRLKGDCMAVKRLLGIAFIDSQPIKERLPSWLYRFVHAHRTGRYNRIMLYENYGMLLKTRHLIDRFQSNKPLLKNYYSKLAESMFESTPDSQTISQIINGEKPSIDEKYAQKQCCDDDIALLMKLRVQYKSKVQTKTKAPSFDVDIPPSRFGLPLTHPRLFNLVVNKLAKIQDYFGRYTPLSVADLEYLDRLVVSDFLKQNPSVCRGYDEFIRVSFAISDDAMVILPKLNLRIFPASENLLEYYKKAGE